MKKPDKTKLVSQEKDNYNLAAMLKTAKARCKRLETALKVIHTWASCDAYSPDSREKAMSDIAKCAKDSIFPANK